MSKLTHSRPKENFEPTLFVDGKGAVLGRLASYTAKQVLLGKVVAILNCNEVIVTGRRNSVIQHYKEARARGGPSITGPHFPKTPEKLVKRTIRGMLSHHQGRGRFAHKRVRCFNAVPNEYANAKTIALPTREISIETMTLKEIGSLL